MIDEMDIVILFSKRHDMMFLPYRPPLLTGESSLLLQGAMRQGNEKC